MATRKGSRNALLAMLVATGAAQSLAPQAQADSTWNNTSTDWFSPGAWNGGVPNALSSAIFPASGVPTIPTTGNATASVLGISINNTSGAYRINADVSNGTTVGTLQLGLGSFATVGAGITNVNATVQLTAPTTFDIGTNNRTVLVGFTRGASAITKDGLGTLQLDRAAVLSPGVTTVINAGVLEVRNNLALGNVPNITVNSGAVLQLDPHLSYSGGVPVLTKLTFGDDTNAQANVTTLNNGATLRSTGTGALSCALYGRTKIQNGGSVNIVLPTNGDLALGAGVANTIPALGPVASQITVNGAGIFTVNHDAGNELDAYTGNWIIDHGVAGGFTGQTYINDYNALGVTPTGVAATVDLRSGFLTDVSSTAANPVPNAITLNGGVLNALSKLGSTIRTDAYFSGPINVQAAGGSTIDMSSTNVAALAGPLCNITLSGPISGSAPLVITAPTTIGGVVAATTFSNTSAATPNTISSPITVQARGALAATGANGGSNPLGTSAITLAAGELRLSHPGVSDNATIGAFAANSLALRGLSNPDLGSLPTHDGTLTIGNGLASAGFVGSTVVLNKLTFNPGGSVDDNDQTLTVQNARAGVNYKARFDGVTTFAGNATITTGTNPADVVLNGGISGSGNFSKAGNNTVTVNGGNFSGTTSVHAGTLVYGASTSIGALTVHSGAGAVVSAGGAKVLKATSLDIAGTGTLDLNDNKAIFTATTLGYVQNAITQAAAGGWSGDGITSSYAAAIAADNGAVHKTALGYATAGQIGASSFAGTSVNAGDVLVRYTLQGDANLDGEVDSMDFNAISASFNQSGKTWAEGDFNYDGTVNALDFNAIASNFGIPVPGPVPQFGSVVPEPSCITALIGAGMLVRRRKRL